MPTIDQQALQDRLQELATKYDVPGASLAVLTPDGVVTAAVGELNRDTGVEATTDSLFQIGSITKVYTAALVMQTGRARGARPRRAGHRPTCRSSGSPTKTATQHGHPPAPAAATRAASTATTSWTPAAATTYSRSTSPRAPSLAQQFPVGATMSYCNAGFGIIGRVLEVVTGKVWDQVLREELLDAARASSTRSRCPRSVLRFRTACGHVGEPGDAAADPAVGHPAVVAARPA